MKEFKPTGGHLGPSEQVLAKEAEGAERAAEAGEFDHHSEIMRAQKEMEEKEM